MTCTTPKRVGSLQSTKAGSSTFSCQLLDPDYRLDGHDRSCYAAKQAIAIESCIDSRRLLRAGGPSQGQTAQAPGPPSGALVLSVVALFPPGTQAAAQNLFGLLTSSSSSLLQAVTNIAGPLSISGKQLLSLLCA